MNNYSPIVIFCYRRKIDKLIFSLTKNKESTQTELYIFSDGSKSEEDKKDVIEIRKDLKKINGFKAVQIFESDKNKGLAQSIIDGASQIIKKYNKIIVLEDDLVVSPYFLNFMNNSLNIYKKKKNIWSISGYGPVINKLDNFKKDVYLTLRSSSWGWATWIDRWNKVDWNIKNFEDLKKNNEEIKKFELGGNDLFKMLELQYYGKIDSWAIRWCYSQFIHSAFSVTPKISMVQNIGFKDSLGTHNFGKGKKWKVKLATSKINNFEVSFDNEVANLYKNFYDINLLTRISYFLKKWINYNLRKNLIRKF